MKAGKTIMIQGTGSGVGKSVITSALCRIFRQDGYSVAPFKAQNMALNSFVTEDGGEIGRAQAVQAQAAKVKPTVDMNPVLIKPSSDMMAQIIVLGKPLGNKSASGYTNFKGRLFPTVKNSLRNLRKAHDIVVMEGAGSPAEVNLRKNDIVNMSIALANKTPVILVGDIDKGGVLASIVGTLELISRSERELVKGFIINKFRGDIKLFKDGVSFLERRTGIKVLGVIPYYRGIDLPEEDAIPWEKKTGKNATRLIQIAVLCLPHLSNFTDFDLLEQEPDIALTYVKSASEFGDPDAVILPGTKSTIADLQWLRRSGLADKILDYAANKNGTIIGLCGGFQMLGKQVLDKDHLESKTGSAEGLSLLPVATSLQKAKTLRQITAVHIASGSKVLGYEIHHGKTLLEKGCKPAFNIRGTDAADGAISKDGRIWGTYIHGVFDDFEMRDSFINALRAKKGIAPRSFRERNTDIEFDKLAGHVRKNIDVKALYKIVGAATPAGVGKPVKTGSSPATVRE
jgi:adenosylcobyric acid synthase